MKADPDNGESFWASVPILRVANLSNQSAVDEIQAPVYEVVLDDFLGDARNARAKYASFGLSKDTDTRPQSEIQQYGERGMHLVGAAVVDGESNLSHK